MVGARVELAGGINQSHSEWTTEAREMKPGVCVARAVVTDAIEEVPVQLMNLTCHAIHVKTDEYVTDLSPVEVMDVVSEDGRTIGARYEHLTGLLEELDEGISDVENTRLKLLLEEYADFLSANEYDLGETSILCHNIDTSATKPLKQVLRRQPVMLLDKIDGGGDDESEGN